jgi:hypothetical protein
MFCVYCLRPIEDEYWELRWLTTPRGFVNARGPYCKIEEIHTPPTPVVYEIVHRSFAEDRFEDEGGGFVS